jgi:Fe-coproporphyrin III synthase
MDMGNIIRLIKATYRLIFAYTKYKLTKKVDTVSVAIDITSMCDLRCKHCYLFRDETEPYSMSRRKQLTDEEWLARIDKMKKEHPSIVHATWVGGEPFIRKDLLKKATSKFLLNWVATNGTLTFPEDLNDNTTFVVSIDGPERYHDEIRGQGMFSIAFENVQKTNARVYSHSVINRINQDGIEEMTGHLRGTRIRGVRFSFYTPEYNTEDPLWLKPEERTKSLRDCMR